MRLSSAAGRRGGVGWLVRRQVPARARVFGLASLEIDVLDAGLIHLV